LLRASVMVRDIYATSDNSVSPSITSIGSRTGDAESEDIKEGF